MENLPSKYYDRFCFECKIFPIIGNGYHCTICKLDFCKNCYEEIKFTHPHELKEIKKYKKREFSFEVTDQNVIDYLKENNNPNEYINYIKNNKDELDKIREQIFLEKEKGYFHDFSGNEENIVIIKLEITPEFINDFNKIVFKNLKNLEFTKNNLKSIDFLKSMNFPNLTKLKISINPIDDLTPLINIEARNLNSLCLSDNLIYDISQLEYFKFPRLNNLNLSKNKIRDISILKKFDKIFPELLVLNLYYNNINSIDCLKGIILSKLERLSLSNNKIERINVFENCYFPNLNDLDLYDNKIFDISVIEYIKFPKLNSIDLHLNEIRSIKSILFINKQNLPCLKFLNISKNFFDFYQENDIDKYKKNAYKYKCQIRLSYSKNVFDTDNVDFATIHGNRIPSYLEAFLYLLPSKTVNFARRVVRKVLSLISDKFIRMGKSLTKINHGGG